jgi:hypothetical protein
MKSEPRVAKSKEAIAFELMRSLIAADENYQEELKLYSEFVSAVKARPTIIGSRPGRYSARQITRERNGDYEKAGAGVVRLLASTAVQRVIVARIRTNAGLCKRRGACLANGGRQDASF